MIAIVQRVLSAAVTADGLPAGEIGPGLLILLGVVDGDGKAEAATLAAKTANLRIFCDEADKMNRSLLDTAGGALVVSNFTLAADVRKGNRPSPGRPRRTWPSGCMRLIWPSCGGWASPGWRAAASAPICRLP